MDATCWVCGTKKPVVAFFDNGHFTLHAGTRRPMPVQPVAGSDYYRRYYFARIEQFENSIYAWYLSSFSPTKNSQFKQLEITIYI